MKSIKVLSGILLAVLLVFSSCRKDEYLLDPSAQLAFSTDSITFDTVFTTVGSTTRIFKVFNQHSEPLNISRIFLGKGNSSEFRINVDGVSAASHTDVEILGGDSLYVFVQVTVNPTNINSPLLIHDSVVFETNGNIQDVDLIAIGQDVYLHKPDHFPTNGLPNYSIIDCNDIWTNDKPHLIFGYAVVDSNCTLTMNPGTRVHLHKNAVLWIYKEGSLVINGAKGSEVVIQGDRLEPEYKEVPGQWGKIWMMKGSRNNQINYAIIKNGNIGIQVDSGYAGATRTLRLHNTVVRNMLAAGLYGQGAHIWSSNSVFANCGQYVAALTLGGSYKFEHCTFANYYNFNTGGSTSSEERSTPLLVMNNYYIDFSNTIQIRGLDSCYFGNCIIYGDLDEEIGMDTVPGVSANFEYRFDHSLIKSTRPIPNGSHYFNAYKNVDAGFRDVNANDYQLKSSSLNSIDKGNPAVFIPQDLNMQPRPNGLLPDLGAYEFY
jgi:hypothetical protein